MEWKLAISQLKLQLPSAQFRAGEEEEETTYIMASIQSATTSSPILLAHSALYTRYLSSTSPLLTSASYYTTLQVLKSSVDKFTFKVADTTFFLLLPTDLYSHIFQFLTLSDSLPLSLLSRAHLHRYCQYQQQWYEQEWRRFNDVAATDSPPVWHSWNLNQRIICTNWIKQVTISSPYYCYMQCACIYTHAHNGI